MHKGMEEVSIVEYFGPGEGHSCGYCKASNTNFSYGMWAYQMTSEDYQNLIDRGWRRSGMYVYRPQLDLQCCPMYTLKCDVMNFKASHSHKKIIKTFNRYINYGIIPKKYQSEDGKTVTTQGGGDDNDDAVAMGNDDADEEDDVNDEMGASNSKTINNSNNNNNNVAGVDEIKSSGKNPPKPGTGADPSKPPAQKAKGMRMMKKKMKKMGEGGEVEAGDEQATTTTATTATAAATTAATTTKRLKSQEKSLEDFLNDFVEKPVHKFEITTIPCTETHTDHLLNTSHSIYHRYQTTIHHDPPSKPSTKQFKRFLIKSPIFNNTPTIQNHLITSPSTTISTPTNIPTSNTTHTTTTTTNTIPQPSSSLPKLTSSSSSSSASSSSSSLPKPTSSSSSSPSSSSTNATDSLHNEPPIRTSPSGPKGSFHQQYFIDDKLVCVGVIDILSHCVSSVYLFYDPHFAFLSLGTYTALREVAYTRQLQQHDNNITSYYMGFYIHTCPKMKYKGQYHPSYLLCPESFTWQPIGRCLDLIDKHKYSRLAHIDQVDPGILGMNTNEVGILHKRMIKYEEYKALRRRKGRSDDDNEVNEYANLVGKKCAYSMLLHRK